MGVHQTHLALFSASVPALLIGGRHLFGPGLIEGRAGTNWVGLEWHFEEKLSLIPVCIFSLGGAEEGVAALCST